MVEIIFNAFSFLQPKLKQRKVDYNNAKMTVPAGMTVAELICHVGLSDADVEGAFVNGKIVSLDSALAHGDRVALVPPGTPGPYRVMLGLVKLDKRSSRCP